MTVSIIPDAGGRVSAEVPATLAAAVTAIALSALLETVRCAAEAVGPDELARRCNRSRRSLSRDLFASGMPPPSALLAWGRILLAIELLHDRTVSVERAAYEVGLPDSAALVHLCRRHAGPTPGEIRELGGLKHAIGLLKDQITINKSTRAS